MSNDDWDSNESQPKKAGKKPENEHPAGDDGAWGDTTDTDGFGEPDPVLSLDDDLGEVAFDEDGNPIIDEADDGDQAEGVSAEADEESAASKKKKKMKTYAMLAGIGVLLASGVGGAFAYKQSKKNAAIYEQPVASAAMPIENDDVPPPPKKPRPPVAPNAPQPITSAPATPAVAPAQPTQPTPQPAQGANTAIPLTPPATSPLAVQADAEAVRQAPILAPSQFADQSTQASIEDLTKKADMLAVSFVRFREASNTRIQSVETTIMEISKSIGQQGAKIAELDAAISEIKAAVAKISERLDAMPVARGKTDAKKDAPKEPEVRAEAQKPAAKSAEAKPDAKAPESKPTEPKAQASTAPRPAGLSGFRVVATYPSTTQSAMPAQKAWITNGEKLIEVSVGSTINGAKVTGFDGMKVVTSAGVINPAR